MTIGDVDQSKYSRFLFLKVLTLNGFQVLTSMRDPLFKRNSGVGGRCSNIRKGKKQVFCDMKQRE